MPQANRLLIVLVSLAGCAAHPPVIVAPPVAVERIDFMGWPGAVRLSNPSCELIIVPQISRVMHFSLRGRANVLWVNPELTGRTFGPGGKEWHNYGGEKVWPTQQSLFPKYAGKAWPPPWPWDGGASTAKIIPDGVRLTLPHDPNFGAHLVREFVMDRREALVHVRQWIEKTDGPPVSMTIWSVCQVEDPDDAALLPAGEPGPDGAVFRAIGTASPLMRRDRSAVTLGRDPKKGIKIGVRCAEPSAWAAVVSPGALFVVAHANRPGASYPDEGCNAELYTSPQSGVHYTELELLSPLVMLKAGDTLRDDQTWRLIELPTDGMDRSIDAFAELARSAFAVTRHRRCARRRRGLLRVARRHELEHAAGVGVGTGR